MFENYPNYDSINSDREREEKLMQDKKDRCHKNGKLYLIFSFLSVLGTPAIFVLAIVGAVVAVLLNSKGTEYLVIGLISAVALAIGIAIAVILFLLGREESCFTAAGIAYVVLTLLDMAAEFLPEGFLQSIFKILAAIAGLFYLFEFINGSVNILAGVDNYLSSTWETFRKVMIYILVGMVACVILCFIPIIQIIAIIVLVIGALGAFGVLIWEYVLMFKTAIALKNF